MTNRVGQNDKNSVCQGTVEIKLTELLTQQKTLDFKSQSGLQ